MPTPTSTRGPIVLAEDDDLTGMLLSALLRPFGRDVVRVSDGNGALEALSRHPQLMILDLHLPHRTGFEILRLLRAKKTGADVRVLVVSSQARPGTEEQVRRLGADAFVPKPVAPQHFQATVRRLLEA